MSQPILVALRGAKGSFSISAMDLVLQVYVATSSDDSRVDQIMHVCWQSVVEPSFFEDGGMAGWIVRVISFC